MLAVFLESFVVMGFCCKTSNFHVDIGHPLALLSVLFAMFVSCIHGSFSLLW
jgi:hypothetical protein